VIYLLTDALPWIVVGVLLVVVARLVAVAVVASDFGSRASNLTVKSAPAPLPVCRSIPVPFQVKRRQRIRVVR
jgi:hypothetical protein